MRLDEISRRGFLKGAAAAATIPSSEVSGIIKTFTDSLGGASNVKILEKLLSKYGVSRVSEFMQYAIGDASIDYALTRAESDKIASTISAKYSREQIGHWLGVPSKELSNSEIISFYEQNSDKDNIWEEITKITGQKPEYLNVVDFINSNGSNAEKFFDLESGFGRTINNLYTDKFGAKSAGITVDNLAQAARDASLPMRSVRLAGLITSIIKKVVTKVRDIPPTPEKPTLPAVKDAPPQLPAPSNNNDELGINQFNRMKDFARVPRK